MDNNNRENLPPPERGGFLNLLQEEDHEGGMNGQSNGNHDGAHGGAHAVFSNGYSNGHDQGNGNIHGNNNGHDHVNGNGHSLSNGNGNGLDVSHAEAINGQSHAELQVVPHHQLLVSDAQLVSHLPPLQNHHLVQPVQPQPLMEGSILQAQLVDPQPHHLELQPFQPNNFPIITVTSLDSGPTSPQPGPSRTSRGQKRKCSGGVKASYKRDKNGKKKSPYTPSYMSRDEKCVVCDDLATGYHYRRMTCEGCKGFFRRTYQRNKQNSYTCKFSKNCVINKETRNACQYCRHKKCLVKGMCPDLVLDEIARRQKKRLIQLNRQKRAQNAKEEEQKEQMLDKENNIRVTITYNAYVFSMNLTMHQREEDLGDWDPIQRLTKMLDNCMERLGSFATQLPEFMKMSDADKCALLKGSFTDVLIVMSAEHYNPQTNQVRIGGFLVDLDKEREHYPVTYQLMEVLHRNSKLISNFHFNRESLSLLAQNGLFKINNIALEDPDAVDMIKGETLHLSFLYDGSKEKKCLQTRGMVAVVVAEQEVQTEFERLKMIKEGELPQTLLELMDKDLPAYSPFWLKCLETHSSFLDPSHDQQLELPLPFADVDNLQDVLP